MEVPKKSSAEQWNTRASQRRSQLGRKSTRTAMSLPLRSPPSVQSSSGLHLIRRSSLSKLIEVKLADFTINKLKIDSLDLVGRETETGTLKGCLDRMMKAHEESNVTDANNLHVNSVVYSDVKKEIVLLKGYSGVGKTSVAKSIKRHVMRKQHGCFVEGKYDMNNDKEHPYSAIASAYGKALRHLKDRRPEECLKMGQELCRLAGREVEALTYLIPELDGIVDDYSSSSFSESSDDSRLAKRWKYAFRVLTRLLTSRLCPLVLLIDDLQWADHASLGLIEWLINDIQNPNPLMLIGCYRSNELDTNSTLVKMLESLDKTSDSYGFNTTDIDVKNCNDDQVNQILMKMMAMDEEESTRDLAKVCYQRTQGNPFFLIEFAKMLQSEKLLQFSLGTMKWTWDAEKIEEETVSTSNVVDLLLSKMESMPFEIQQLLHAAACLGPAFRHTTLHLIWTLVLRCGGGEESPETVSRRLAIAEEAMMIERCGDDRYRWVHDKVQQAALLLFKSNENDDADFMFRLGRVLYQNLRSKQLEEDLFDVVDLINKGDKAKLGDFVELYLRAAKKARQMSAFYSASSYSSKGIELLPKDKWDSCRSIALELYTISAEVDYSLGNFEASEKSCFVVLNSEKLTLMEKFSFRLIQNNIIHFVHLRSEKMIENSMTLLEELGFDFSLRRLDRLKSKIFNVKKKSVLSHDASLTLYNTIKMLVSKPLEFYSSLPVMKDLKCKRICLLLYRIQLACYMTGDFTTSSLCVCYMVTLTLQHGIGEMSPTGIACIACSCRIGLQNYCDTNYLADIALALQERLGQTNRNLVLQTLYHGSLSWTKKFFSYYQENVMYDAYLLGIQNGDTEQSLYSLTIHLLLLPWILGKPIQKMITQCPKILVQAQQVGHSNIVTQIRCFWQMLLNMEHPQCVDPTKVKGDVANEANMNRSISFLAAALHLAESRLKLLYDRPSLAELAIECGDLFHKLNPATFQVMEETFYRGVSLYSTARQMKRSLRRLKYERHASRVYKTIRKWEDAGNPNVSEYRILLDAEKAALHGKRQKAEQNYQTAIRLSARAGHLRHAGLFNELYAEFLYQGCSDVDEAMYRWEESIHYYQEWGALRKADMLQDRMQIVSIGDFEGLVE